MAKIESEY